MVLSYGHQSRLAQRLCVLTDLCSYTCAKMSTLGKRKIEEGTIDDKVVTPVEPERNCSL